MLRRIILIDLGHYCEVNDNLCHGRIQGRAFIIMDIIKEFLTGPGVELPDQGKTIVLEGDVKFVTAPVSELRHYATDAGKPQSEIDAITQPGDHPWI